MADFFAKVRSRRTVLKRTRPSSELPPAILYLEWLNTEGKRKVLDPEGKEHVLTDKVIMSNYKIVNKGKAEELIKAHWAEQAAKAQEPLRKTEG
jgi:hypothetical protein